MRKKIAQQLPLTPGYAEHERGDELSAISAILDRHHEILDLVAADLPERATQESAGGRPGMTADQVLRSMIIKQMHGFSYELLAFHLADSVSFQAFCRVSPWLGCPSRSALQSNIKLIRPETLEEINRVLIGFAEKAGVERGKKVRFDCTVTATDIHEPTDSLLLWDVVRVLVRLMGKAKENWGVHFASRERRAKRRAVGIASAATNKARKPLYRDLIAATEDTLTSAREVREQLETIAASRASDGPAVTALMEKIEHFVALGERVIDQTRRRIFEGEIVPAGEKIVSIFEVHTDIIVKDRRETFYGHKLCLATGASGLVLDCVVQDGNPADSTLAVDMVRRQADLYGRVPKQAALDGGFASKKNLSEIKDLGVEDVMFSKRRGLKIPEMVRSTWVYRQLRDFRAGIEGGISFLKRCFGLRRCTWRGLSSFKSYAWASVISANLLMLARDRLRVVT